MRYESEVLYDLMKRDGLLNPSQDNLPYESELKEKYVDEVKGAYPKVTDYRPEWLNYNLGYYIPADFPTESLVNVTSRTVNNVIPYAYKRAILKGQTLVNLMKAKERTRTAKGSYVSMFEDSKSFSQELKPNTQYLYIMDIIESTLIGGDRSISIGNTDSNQLSAFINRVDFPANSKGMIKCVLTTRNSFDGIFTFLRNQLNPSATSGSITYRQMLIEYQQGMENWDIPYFEGMKSVQMPVLTTTGKNLFDGELTSGTINGSNGVISNSATRFYTSEPILLQANLPYAFTISSTQENADIKFRQLILYKDKKLTSFTKTYGDKFNQLTYTPTEDVYAVLTVFDAMSEQKVDIDKVFIQIEQGSATPYEPYKSNILTVNEPVELRGIGDVQDTLDCLTGEVTERIGEMILDGSETWFLGTTKEKTQVFYIPEDSDKIVDMKKNTLILCDKLKVASGIDEEIIVLTSSIYLGLLKSKASTVEELKVYLSQNPITIQYQLATESIKPVDLTSVNQDGVPSTFRPFEGTMHIKTDGEPLKPLLDMEIPVEATTQNLASFVNLEGVERTVNEYVDEEIVGDDNDEQLL